MIVPVDADRRAVLRRIKHDIKKHGQTVMYIFGDDSPFHYTIGRALRGLPELLLVVPIKPEIGMSLLNHLDRLMPQALPSGSLVDLGGKFPMKVIDASGIAQEEYTCLVNQFADEYRVQQVLCCDAEGRFPPDCAAPYNRQPILAAS
jgi:hypothetical protein